MVAARKRPRNSLRELSLEPLRRRTTTQSDPKSVGEQRRSDTLASRKACSTSPSSARPLRRRADRRKHEVFRSPEKKSPSPERFIAQASPSQSPPSTSPISGNFMSSPSTPPTQDELLVRFNALLTRFNDAAENSRDVPDQPRRAHAINSLQPASAASRIDKPKDVAPSKCSESIQDASRSARSRKPKSPVRRRDFVDTDGVDWSRELRGWSPERRQDQARKRAEAEEIVRAKEEAEEEANQVNDNRVLSTEAETAHRDRASEVQASQVASSMDQTPSDDNAVNHTDLSQSDQCTSATTMTCAARSEQDDDVENEPTAASVSSSTSLLATASGNEKVIVKDEQIQLVENDTCVVKDEQIQMAETFAVKDEQVHLLTESYPLAETDALLATIEPPVVGASIQNEAVTSDLRHNPPADAAALLEELISGAENFEAGDYWVNGAWDMDALQEDADQRRQERWAHEEKLWQQDYSAFESSQNTSCPPSQNASQDQSQDAACLGPVEQTRSLSLNSDSAEQIERSRERSPSPEYPIFTTQQPRKLAFCLSSSSKQCAMSDCDRALREKLRYLLGA